MLAARRDWTCVAVRPALCDGTEVDTVGDSPLLVPCARAVAARRNMRLRMSSGWKDELSAERVSGLSMVEVEERV